jgi:hypothetical protein
MGEQKRVISAARQRAASIARTRRAERGIIKGVEKLRQRQLVIEKRLKSLGLKPEQPLPL